MSESAPCTPCECTGPGWCPRHKCEKYPHFFELCQTRKDYFDLWEIGKGPGQIGTASETQSPSLLQKVWNVASAVATFIADGCKTVGSAQYKERLAICDGCERRAGIECMLCGCNLPLKAQGRAMSCPLGKWPDLRESAEVSAADGGTAPAS